MRKTVVSRWVWLRLTGLTIMGVLILDTMSFGYLRTKAYGYGVAWYAARAETEYAADYTDEAFSNVAIGDAKESVLRALGDPIWIERVDRKERWYFEEDGVMVLVGDRTKESTWGHVYELRNPERILRATVGATRPTPAAILEELGEPSRREVHSDREWLWYSHSPKHSHYFQRRILIDRLTGKVVDKRAVLWIDRR